MFVVQLCDMEAAVEPTILSNRFNTKNWKSRETLSIIKHN